MVYKISPLKNFVKLRTKHLWQSLTINMAASWKISQNLQENTFEISVLVTLLAEKFLKIHKKSPTPESSFWKSSSLKIFGKFTENVCVRVKFLIKLQAEKICKFAIQHICWNLVFNKGASWRYNNIKWLIHLHFLSTKYI